MYKNCQNFGDFKSVNLTKFYFMNEELIIQQLKDKEAHLLNELNKVRLALKAFIDENMSKR